MQRFLSYRHSVPLFYCFKSIEVVNGHEGGAQSRKRRFPHAISRERRVSRTSEERRHGRSLHPLLRLQSALLRFCRVLPCVTFVSLVPLQAKRTKKVGVVGKYGTRYGASLRKMAKKIEITQHARYTCMFCGKVSRSEQRAYRGLPQGTLNSVPYDRTQ